MKIWLSIFFLTLPFFVSAVTFNRNLQIGSRGEDVRFLQSILNQEEETQIAKFGPGSPGQETDFFGAATKRALIKFQEKYRQEVLLPLGLSRGTGFAGLLTRLKLQNISNSPSNKVVPPTNPSIVIPTPVVSPPLTPSVPAPTPSSINLPSNSSVKRRSSTMRLVSLSPDVVTGAVQMEIKGEGFSKTGNKIYTGYGVLENVPSSDGKTLSFFFDYKMKEMSKERMSSDYDKYPVVREIPLGIYVENETGVSNGLLFRLKY